MATGFRNRAGTDWDDLFEPEVGGNGVGDPKFRRSNGTIIRFAKRALGSAVASVEAGRTDGGGDAATLWAKKGSVSYAIASLQGKAFEQTKYASSQYDAVSVEINFNLRANGTWDITGTGIAGGNSVRNGTWLTTGGASSDYQASYTGTRSGSPDAVIETLDGTWHAIGGGVRLSMPSVSAGGGTARDRSTLAVVTLKIRRISTGDVVSTTLFYLQATTHGYQ